MKKSMFKISALSMFVLLIFVGSFSSLEGSHNTIVARDYSHGLNMGTYDAAAYFWPQNTSLISCLNVNTTIEQTDDPNSISGINVDQGIGTGNCLVKNIDFGSNYDLQIQVLNNLINSNTGSEKRYWQGFKIGFETEINRRRALYGL